MAEKCFRNFTLIDTKNGDCLDNITMIIEKDEITALAADSDLKAEYESSGMDVIDCTGKFIMPGLCNAHVHIMFTGEKLPRASSLNHKLVQFLAGLPVIRNILMKKRQQVLKTSLNSGITVLRVLGDVNWGDIKIRDETNSGKIFGPHILAAGRSITPVGGHGAAMSYVVNSEAEARAAVKELYLRRVDCIKVLQTKGVTDADDLASVGGPIMPKAILAAIADEADKYNIPVTAHSENSESVRECVECGVNIEHGAEIDEDTVLMMKEKGLFYCPTILAPRVYLETPPEKTGLSDLHIKAGDIVEKKMVNGLKSLIEYSQKNFGSKNCLIIAGSDAGIPMCLHDKFARELGFYVDEFGLTPMEAIQTATYNAGLALSIADKYGCLEAGKWADFLIFDKNPMDNLNILLEPSRFEVWCRGTKVIKN
ncbi:Amidohydrolase 1 [Syntrophomonas zehnderi OL-4]|uniref:Amidohydrolase 1 n=1 Tax=Syntrophomonas zehnderi OL-4 TaxID=690567 RepID=A0A0E4GBJ4_9FIRM|nr:amidohydrolase family protein [Syntrophomonas zehnderi]CFX88585.1 Amidohydrolase 1 [Syntrophomonas zehnderi OL-4]